MNQDPKQTNNDNAPQEDKQEFPRDYYETLKLKPNATMSQIESSYKHLSLKHHPQQYKDKSNKPNDITFAHISEAYQALIDPARRKQYDEYLKKNPVTPKTRESDVYPYHNYHMMMPEERFYLSPFHFRSHPASPFFSLYGYHPINPFEHFNYFLNHGLFDSEDLEFFDLSTGQLGNQRDKDDFFAENDLRDYMKKNNVNSVQASKLVTKNTKFENGVRTTITETKKIGPDGVETHFIKEETDDGKGNKSLKYLDKLPDKKREEIKTHIETPQTKETGDDRKSEGVKGDDGKQEGMKIEK